MDDILHLQNLRGEKGYRAFFVSNKDYFVIDIKTGELVIILTQVDLPQRSFRQSVPPKRLSYMALMTKSINSEPSSFEEVVQDDMWQEGMVEEYDSIMKNQVWEIVPRPEGKKVVGSTR